MSKSGITLYRGETPGAVGFDVHGGYGQTWTTDAKYAAGYADPPHGSVKEAILPCTAKRLVLVTSDDEGYSDYNLNGIETLQEITGVPYIKAMLESNYKQLYDSWREEWTLALIQAGYDSVATLGFDGPEEYVLNPSRLILIRSTTIAECLRNV